jgi:RNAse (barnase) inhibitor barstar
MSKHEIDGAKISDWESFHTVFSKEFMFPSYYGKNMDAWIDCMSDLDSEGEMISIWIKNVNALKSENQEIYMALIECSAFVNYRYVSEGGSPLIALSFYE